MRVLIVLIILGFIGCSISYDPCETKIEGLVNSECIGKELDKRR